MSKKIIAVSVCILLTAVLFVACGKKDFDPAETTTGKLEYTTDEDGNQYVTNINGELIPVTTGKDGSVEFIDDLVTKTKAQADKEKEEQKKDEENNDKNNGGNDNQGGGNNEDKTTDATTTNPGGIIIGDDDVKDGSHDAVIDWGA